MAIRGNSKPLGYLVQTESVICHGINPHKMNEDVGEAYLL